MKLLLTTLFTAQLLILPSGLFSQSGKITISKEPVWVTKNFINYNKTSLDQYATDGFIIIDHEDQISLTDQIEYIKRSMKIISQAGVQNASTISITFDPLYQQLSFNSIKIIRNGESIDKLNLSKIKTVQQEKELANYIYNGSLNALLILEDVRQGDIIEYSYTLKGFNPIFKNKFAREFSINLAIPVYNNYYKLIVPPGRKINTKTLNQNLEPLTSMSNGQLIYEWHNKDIKPLILQDFTPSWYDPYTEVLVSEYNNWREVNDWALELFPLKKKLSSAVYKKIDEIKRNYASDEERIKMVLRFVQDDIRYMGIEMGENSHRPADPSKVFAQRFGDCKEKSYLMCCMLREMNIEADPVLINTDKKGTLTDLLPSSSAFDHVTVRVKLDSSYYWFDPTISYQRGSIKDLYFPDFQTGLVISENTNSLTPIAFRNVSFVSIKDSFKIRDMSGSGTLTVTSSFHGNDADKMRTEFNNSNVSELMTNYQKFYSTYFGDIKAESLDHIDNDSTGTFTTTEIYVIPKFWKVDKSNFKKFTFCAFGINGILQNVKEKERTMPIGISFPSKFNEVVSIELPSKWQITENETHKKNTCYEYNYHFYCLDNFVYLKADYQNLKDYASVEESPTYFSDLNQAEDFASFEITSGDEGVTKNTTPSGKGYLPAFLAVGLIIGGIVWWSKRK